MTDTLPALSPGKPATKSGTNAERVVWMTRTSDVLGSHIKTDIDSYMALIRRKIQEKCATTAELITQIRRYKIGESGHVTPNEFRFTLIKFGIILPQPLVDRIFNVFDSDRSGTMDFDEFAMWIMNSEFRPVDAGRRAEKMDTPRTVLRKKLQSVVNDHRRAFATMKKRISFLQFNADIHRLQMKLTDEEARRIFLVLDPDDTGFINSVALLTWADTGNVVKNIPEAEIVKEISAKNLEDLVAKVIGRNTTHLETSFAHVPRGERIKISFDEFRRCLLNAGVGKNIHASKQLFMALGGAKDGLADIDLLFSNLAPILVDPSTAVSAKRIPTADISASRADRRLRDAMRKAFKIVRSDLEAVDKDASGFVDAESLYKILVHRCTPLTFQDFRFIIKDIDKEPSSNRIDIAHFLHGYNPVIAPHALQGSTIKSYDRSASFDAEDGLLGMGSRNNSAALTAHKKTRNKGLSASFSGTSLTGTGGIGGGNYNNTSTDAARDIALKKAAIKAGASRSGSRARTAGSSNDPLRRVWQTVLRECHRADPERSGQIRRNVFISALEKGNLDKSMSAEMMNKLADNYSLSNGLINYLHLFRSYLNDLTNQTGTGSSSSAALLAPLTGGGSSLQKSGELKPLHGAPHVHPWEYDYQRTKHPEHPYWHDATAHPKETEAETEKTIKAKLQLSLTGGGEGTGAAASRSATATRTASANGASLANYSAKVQDICASCQEAFIEADKLRQIRNLFKKAQDRATPAAARGCVPTPQFLAILETMGINLAKNDLAMLVRVFRGAGAQDVIKYDEFLRVSMLSAQGRQ